MTPAVIYVGQWAAHCIRRSSDVTFHGVLRNAITSWTAGQLSSIRHRRRKRHEKLRISLLVACGSLVSHSKYADGTDRQTDGCQTVTLCFPVDAAVEINKPIRKTQQWKRLQRLANKRFVTTWSTFTIDILQLRWSTRFLTALAST